MPAPVHLDAATVTPEWSPLGELYLWGDSVVVIEGATADIRALLSRALDLPIPTDPKGETE